MAISGVFLVLQAVQDQLVQELLFRSPHKHRQIPNSYDTLLKVGHKYESFVLECDVSLNYKMENSEFGNFIQSPGLKYGPLGIQTSKH